MDEPKVRWYHNNFLVAMAVLIAVLLAGWGVTRLLPSNKKAPAPPAKSANDSRELPRDVPADPPTPVPTPAPVSKPPAPPECAAAESSESESLDGNPQAEKLEFSSGPCGGVAVSPETGRYKLPAPYQPTAEQKEVMKSVRSLMRVSFNTQNMPNALDGVPIFMQSLERGRLKIEFTYDKASMERALPAGYAIHATSVCVFPSENDKSVRYSQDGGERGEREVLVTFFESEQADIVPRIVLSCPNDRFLSFPLARIPCNVKCNRAEIQEDGMVYTSFLQDTECELPDGSVVRQELVYTAMECFMRSLELPSISTMHFDTSFPY